RIAAADFAEGRAGLIVVAERRERLAEPQHAFGRARRFGVIGRELEILLGRLARPRALQETLAEEERRLGREPVAGVLGEESTKLLLRLLVLAAAIGIERRIELL